MNRKLHVGCSPLTGTIFAGTVLKDGRTWGTGKQDVTIDALVAVAEHATKFGRPVEITGPDGKLEYRITVEAFLSANKAADTIDPIDTLRAQLVEAQRDAATPTPDAFRKALRLAQRESLDRTGSGVVNWDQADAVMSDEARHLVECYIAAIDAAKGEKNGA